MGSAVDRVLIGNEIYEGDPSLNDDDTCSLFDFGYSFRPVPGVLYDSTNFPVGTPLPPELLEPGDETIRPFKVDSWQLGITVGETLFYVVFILLLLLYEDLTF